MRVTLHVTSGSNAGDVFVFDEHATFLVGRSSEAHVRISDQDASASRNHCLIEINPPYCRLLDLRSLNGTFVNQQRVHNAILRSDDVIQASSTRMEVIIDTLSTQSQDLPNPAPASSFADPPDLSSLGWIVDRELGRGRMGAAYRARRRDDANAIATFRPLRCGLIHSEQTIAEFVHRAKTSPRLRHPGIAALRNIELINDRPCAFLDYADGLTLADALNERGRPLAATEAIDWTRLMLEATAHAHREGAVHGGLKPGNVIVTSSRDPAERIRILDFGLGGVYQSSSLSGIKILSDGHSHLGYAAPERIADFRNALPTADLYSIAAILRFLLTGSPPYDFPASLEKKILMVLQEEPTPLEKQRPDLPADLIEFIDQGLAYDPKDRFPSAEVMLEILNEIDGDDGVSTLP